MEQNQQLNTKSEYELRREKKIAEQSRAQKMQTIKQISKIALIVLVIGGGIGALAWYIAKQPSTPASDVISRSGIHWHPELSIYIKGQKQEIPANIGLGVSEQFIHTHDTSGTLHLEYPGLVTKDDIKLSKFFKIWDKQFNSNCIFDSCNGPNGKVKMLVNGRDSADFDSYLMQDKDNIEIRYE